MKGLTMKQNDEIEFELTDEGKSYIQVDDEFRVLMSLRNWQLQKKTVAQSDTKSQKKGDVSWTAFRYYMTLESCLNDLVHIKTSKVFFNDAQTMLEANAKVIKEISDAFSPTYKIELVKS